MELLASALVLGVVSGLLYALSGAGLVLIYRASGYVSFAHGDIAALGLFASYALYTAGAPYWVIAVVTVLACAMAAGLLAVGVVLPIEKHGALSAAMATIALGIFLQGAATATVGNDARPFPSAGEGTVLTFGPVSLQQPQVVTVIVAAAVFAALGMAFRRTAIGVVIRAANDNPTAALLMGVPAQRIKVLCWIGAGAMAGLAGLFVVPLYSLTPTSVNAILLFGFCAIVIGGFESVAGALIGGVIVGLVANLTAAFLSSGLMFIVLYLVLLGVLLVRPNGLLGRRPLERV
jgi:branched-chain amino acid transport system permease protein